MNIMRKLIFIVMVLGFVAQSWGQVFREKEKIYFGKRANKDYPILYTKDSMPEKFDIVYNANGSILSYKEKKVSDWKNENILDTLVLMKNGYKESFCKGISSNIKAKDGRLHIYMWRMTNFWGNETTKLDSINNFFY